MIGFLFGLGGAAGVGSGEGLFAIGVTFLLNARARLTFSSLVIVGAAGGGLEEEDVMEGGAFFERRRLSCIPGRFFLFSASFGSFLGWSSVLDRLEGRGSLVFDGSVRGACFGREVDRDLEASDER